MTNSQSIDIIIPVYNGSSTISATVQNLLELPITDQWKVMILVVDDCSTDSTISVLSKIKSPRVRILRLAENKGRASACHYGATNSEANYLLFLDNDCSPINKDYLSATIAQLEQGPNVIFGPIGGTGSGFWQRYLTDIENRRLEHAEKGQWLNAMTSANFLIKHDLYDDVGGFNQEYKYYGFEDRDLIIRILSKNPEISFLPKMRVLHDSGNTVNNYCKKMEIAARYSAPLFYRDHLQHYRAMSYGKIDRSVNFKFWLRLLGKVSSTIKWPVIFTAQSLVAIKIVPYKLTKMSVQAASAISYISGTSRRYR